MRVVVGLRGRWSWPTTRHARLLWVGLLFGLAACSGATTTEVEPIDPILATPIEIAPDASGTAATLTVGTTIPLACAVVYGTDESFGSIAVDNDMQGGAHQAHHPLLTGLTPDTEYRYVLQGSDADGNLYRSDTMTFRTPSALDTGLGRNIAPDGNATASSEFSAEFGAGNAIDGDLATEWSSAGDGDEAWIEVDFGESTPVTAVGFRTRQMTDGSAITRTFTVSVDGRSVGPFPTGAEPIVLDQPLVGGIVRFDADQTSGGNTGATEIEIYGTR